MEVFPQDQLDPHGEFKASEGKTFQIHVLLSLASVKVVGNAKKF